MCWDARCGITFGQLLSRKAYYPHACFHFWRLVIFCFLGTDSVFYHWARTVFDTRRRVGKPRAHNCVSDWVRRETAAPSSVSAGCAMLCIRASSAIALPLSNKPGNWNSDAISSLTQTALLARPAPPGRQRRRAAAFFTTPFPFPSRYENKFCFSTLAHRRMNSTAISPEKRELTESAEEISAQLIERHQKLYITILEL